MIISCGIKLRKTVNNLSGFIADKRVSIESESYAESSITLGIGENSSYSPEKGAMVFCDKSFQISINGGDFIVDKFFASFSSMPFTILNTDSDTLSFSVFTF